MSGTPHTNDTVDDGALLSASLAQQLAVVAAGMTHEQRCELMLGFLAACSGMVERLIGHEALRDIHLQLTRLGPVRPVAPTH